MAHIKDFVLATDKGTKEGGTNHQGTRDATTRAYYVRTAHRDILKYRKACKFMWDTALLTTLPSEKATTIIAGLPYGARCGTSITETN